MGSRCARLRQTLTPGEGSAGAAQGRLQFAEHRGDDDERQGHEQAGEQPGQKQLRNRGLGQEAIDDQVDRRRNHDAQRATGGNRAGKQLGVVTQFFRLGQRHRGHGRGSGHGRAGSSREHRGRADIGMNQPPGQPGKPFVQGRIGAGGNAPADQDFTQQHKKRESRSGWTSRKRTRPPGPMPASTGKTEKKWLMPKPSRNRTIPTGMDSASSPSSDSVSARIIVPAPFRCVRRPGRRPA